MAQFTDYGKEIKKRLIDMDQTQTWLCREVSAKTGKYFDDSYLSKICRGNIAPFMEGAIAAINEILGIDASA